MGIYNAQIGFFLRLADFLAQPLRVEHAENSGAVLSRLPGVRILVSLDLRRIEDRDGHPVHDAVCRLGRVVGVAPRADVGNPLFIERVECIQRALLPIVIDVIVGQRRYICSHFPDPLRSPGRAAKSKSLAGCGRPPVCIGKFIVDDQKIGAGQRLPGLVVEAGPDPVLIRDGTPRVLSPLEDHIAHEYDRDLLVRFRFLPRCYPLSVFPGQRLAGGRDDRGSSLRIKRSRPELLHAQFRAFHYAVCRRCHRVLLRHLRIRLRGQRESERRRSRHDKPCQNIGNSTSFSQHRVSPICQATS